MNRDGTHLTLLAGVMRGMQYNVHALRGIDSIEEDGIQVRDEVATHHCCKVRSVARKGIQSGIFGIFEF